MVVMMLIIITFLSASHLPSHYATLSIHSLMEMLAAFRVGIEQFLAGGGAKTIQKGKKAL